MKEDELVAHYLKDILAPEAFDLLDDGAVLPEIAPEYEWVLSTDSMMSDVHLPADTDMAVIADHLLRVNLSDIAGMAAQPYYLLVQLGISRQTAQADFQSFTEGLKQTAQDYGLQLLGGDTISLPPLMQEKGWMAGATIIGKRERCHRVLRSGAKAKDLLVVTGTLGDSVLGLKLLKNKELCEEFKQKYPDYCNFLINRYYRPTPQLQAGYHIRTYANALMDISDGLFLDAGRMLRASKSTHQSGNDLGLSINRDAIPISASAQQFLACYPDYKNNWLAGGGDYELLCAISEEEFSQQALEKETLFHIIGKFDDSGDAFFEEENYLQGFDHFS